jgi:hypothetical protein
MKMIYLSTLICCVGLVASMTASAGFLDDFSKGFKNIEKTIREVEQVLGEPAQQAPTTPSRKTTTTSSEESSQNIGNTGSSSMSDIQLCESAAKWLNAALIEIRPSESYQSIYNKAIDGKDAQFSPTSERVRWVHDQFFEPAFGKKYDEIEDADASRLYALLTKTSQIKKVQQRNTMVNSECFTTIRDMSPSISDNVVKQAGLLFDKRRRPEYRSALSDMRNAPKGLAEYQVQLNEYNPIAQPREQFIKIKLDALHWLELSLSGERNRFISKANEIQAYYDNYDQQKKVRCSDKQQAPDAIRSVSWLYRGGAFHVAATTKRGIRQ